MESIKTCLRSFRAKYSEFGLSTYSIDALHSCRMRYSIREGAYLGQISWMQASAFTVATPIFKLGMLLEATDASASLAAASVRTSSRPRAGNSGGALCKTKSVLKSTLRIFLRGFGSLLISLASLSFSSSLMLSKSTRGL